MKQHFHFLRQGVVALAVLAAGLTSCNRAEYAMLPKTSSYHGTERVAVAPKPAAAPVEAVAPVATEAPAVVATAPVAAAPVAKATKAPAKMSFLQKTLVKKALKNADKVATKMQIKKHSEAAKADKLSGKLRQGVILLIVGLLIEILGAATGLGIIYLLGAIVAIIGLVLIVLALLDEV